MDYTETLKNWGLENYTQEFIEQGITDESFPLIDDDTINIIFQKIGPKLIFKKKFQEYLLENKKIIFEVEDDGTFTFSSTPKSSGFDDNSFDSSTADLIRTLEGSCNDEAKDLPTTSTAIYVENKSKVLIPEALKEDATPPRKKIKSNVFSREEELMECAEEIIKLFPGEEIDTYYVPYASKTKLGLRVPARGKLWSRYLNIKAALRVANRSLVPMANCDQENLSRSPLEEEKKELNFLKSALESDFNQTFPDKTDIIYDHWPVIRDAILKEAGERSVELTRSAPDTQALLVLPLLFNPVTLRKSPKLNWRPTRQEIQCSFFIKIQDYSELEEIIHRRHTTLVKYNLPLQPFGIVVGDVEHPIEFGIVCFEQKYKCDSAISICNNVYSEVKSLMTHLKLFHGVQEMSVFKCAESDCTRDFSSAASFKKHLKTHTFNVSNIKSNFKQETDNLKLPVNQNVDKNICEPENLDTFEKDSSSEFNKFKITLRNKGDSVITKLYGDSTLNRKLVQTVIDSVLDLICEPMDLFKQDLLRILGNAEVDNTKKGLVNDYFFEWDSVFMDLTSDYLRQKYLEKLGLYIKSIEYVTGERFDLLQNDVLKAKAYSAQFVPISPILKLFLELPCVFPEIIKYINDLKCISNISNIIQTDFWKNKLKHFQQSDLVLPLFLYFDEFEIGNPLGSHAGIHKIGAIYWSIPCIPPNYRAHLENIFLVLLFHSSDLKEFGSNAIFLKLVEELTNIQENGIVIVSDQDKIKIKVSLTLCLGDNLGLNTLLGFTESFRANFFCRFCKSHRTQTQEIVLPNHNLIRDKANYETDIQENNASSTGIKEACVFNKIPNFHVTENFCVDLAHDIFEGNVIMIHIHLQKYLLVFLEIWKEENQPSTSDVSRELFNKNTPDYQDVVAISANCPLQEIENKDTINS
ncbi:unnamed protein product [Psylliodes chrysocephalus]|uniref:C2H2-type domain-containing protein n=1 Tax=Psylliodes chrysocephalus TaxID=3402493 RepID=A0A9P0GBF6_9CUCU|nr:unnamed protein product [Psylliodes chrysocephala]